MGIDLHGLRLLQYAASKAPLGDAATLGRQNIHLTDEILRKTFRLPPAKRYGPFCEDLLIEQFGAASVTSFDASEYEHATVVHDMNKLLDHDRQYDTVIDFGTLEHVFDLAVALKNVATICKTGGRIIHALPANNYNGHGFWQFSPELFFSLYSMSNGFAETEVYIAQLDDDRNWWKAAIPANRVRVEYTSASRSYVLVLTRKQAEHTSQNVQQSDYLVNWEQGSATVTAKRKLTRAVVHSTLERVPLIGRHLAHMVPDRHRDAWMHRLSTNNRHYTKVPLTALIPPIVPTRT
jgi:2-polyprenyl-3-methyl-5-hydroxy-6-metoxy-1,4-benzoquinol methylase